MNYQFPELPVRRLMGPGPSEVSPAVLAAMSRPLLGHLDPAFLSLMNEIQELLRRVFETSNPLTIPVSGTGSAGMEAAVVNFVRPGDTVVVGVNGVFGGRMADAVRRQGGNCIPVTAPFGEPLDEKELRAAAEKHRPGLIAVVHAETSTGVLQPLEPVRGICDEVGALLLVDAVTSLGGHPVKVDERRIDICFSGTQKCLSCPPGLSPLTISPTAAEQLRPDCSSWYFDLNMLSSYWGAERTYHHTAPISMNYALREALGLVMSEGLERRWARHRSNHLGLVAGVEALGLKMRVAEKFRLWSLNTIDIPEGIEDARLRKDLLDRFQLEIGGGLGALKGKVWRVGLMGESSSTGNVLFFLHALETCLRSQGFSCPAGAGVQAASHSLSAACETDAQSSLQE